MPHEGDILFQDLDCGPLCKAIENVEPGIYGTHISHVGILCKNKGKWYVAEAYGKVKLTPLNEFLYRTTDKDNNPKVIVARVKKEYKNYLHDLKRKIYQQLNKEYDSNFLPGNDKLYCCELIYYVFTNRSGKHLFDFKPMSFKNRKTGKIDSLWFEYFKKLNGKIPENIPGCNPAAYSKSNKIQIIKSYGRLK